MIAVAESELRDEAAQALFQALADVGGRQGRHVWVMSPEWKTDIISWFLIRPEYFLQAPKLMGEPYSLLGYPIVVRGDAGFPRLIHEAEVGA